MINNKLLQEIEEYCKINNINDIKKEINKMLRIGFNFEKYGDVNFYRQTIKEKVQEKEEEVQEVKEAIQEKPKKRIRIIKN